jgi:hypothetical protein
MLGVAFLLPLLVARNAVLPREHEDLCARRDSIRAVIHNSTGDDRFELVARLLPGGFGGLTTTYMFLKRPELADSVRRMARAVAECPSDGNARLWSLLQTVAVRQGDYDWIELQAQYDVLLKRASWDGVNSADIDEGRNRLAYSIATQVALDAFRARAVSLGVPSGMLVLSVNPPDRTLPRRPPERTNVPGRRMPTGGKAGGSVGRDRGSFEVAAPTR